MQILDVILLIIYLAVTIAIGFLVGRSNKDAEDYFVGGRSMPWYAIGLSVGVTMISANAFIGGPGWGYESGMAAAMMNITVPLAILFVLYTIVPVLYHANVTTIYEYINTRLGPKTRLLNVVIWLCSSLMFVGGFVYTPSLVLSEITGIAFEIWVPVIVIFAILYTAVGGIKAVIWTDAIQAVVLFAGLIFALLFALSIMPLDFGGLVQAAREAEKLKSFDWVLDTESMTVWVVFIGGFAMWIGYFGFDQGQVQRYLSARDMDNIKRSGVLSSIAMQMIFWFCVFLGTCLFIFYQSNESTLDFSNSNLVMTDFMLNYIPTGLLGILLAALFAAAMSSIDSILNSLTAVFTKDIYEPYISKREDTPLSTTILFSVIFGVIIVAFVYAGLGGNTKSILDAIGAYISPFSALVTGTMLVCLFMPRANDNGAFIGILVAAVAVFFTQAYVPMHWLLINPVGAFYCVVLVYAFSLLFEDESEAKLPYTLKGVRQAMRATPSAAGDPFAFDRYGWMILAVFVVHCVILTMLQ